MNRMLKLATTLAGRHTARRGLCHHGEYGKDVGIYHSYKEYARTISFSDVHVPTMKYSEGYAHFNAKYNKVLAAGAVVACITTFLMVSLGYFSVPQHKPMKNTEEGLKFLDYPHEGYHPKLK